MRCVTRQEQEREDAAMQTQQQLEVQKRTDAEQQQRFEAETQLLRLQRDSVLGQIASFHSKFDDILALS